MFTGAFASTATDTYTAWWRISTSACPSRNHPLLVIPRGAEYATRQRRAHCCTAHKFFAAENIGRNYDCCAKRGRAEFLDDNAQTITLPVIFQSIAGKFCNRALFRHAV
jgi:hypothetical protein